MECFTSWQICCSADNGVFHFPYNVAAAATTEWFTFLSMLLQRRQRSVTLSLKCWRSDDNGVQSVKIDNLGLALNQHLIAEEVRKILSIFINFWQSWKVFMTFNVIDVYHSTVPFLNGVCSMFISFLGIVKSIPLQLEVKSNQSIVVCLVKSIPSKVFHSLQMG